MNSGFVFLLQVQIHGTIYHERDLVFVLVFGADPYVKLVPALNNRPLKNSVNKSQRIRAEKG